MNERTARDSRARPRPGSWARAITTAASVAAIPPTSGMRCRSAISAERSKYLSAYSGSLSEWARPMKKLVQQSAAWLEVQVFAAGAARAALGAPLGCRR
jgi:hypothetical protein